MRPIIEKFKKTFDTEEQLIDYLENGDEVNYNYQNKFKTFDDFEDNAKEHFNSITDSEPKSKKKYYERFGLNVGDVQIEHKTVIFHLIEGGNISVIFCEAYIDPGVPLVDYYCGFYILE